MRIGVPRERMTLEGRVALIPDACGDLVRRGHEVLVESGAGQLSGFADSAYAALGASVIADVDHLYDAAQLIVKVKEPLPDELGRLRGEHLLFCFLHLAAQPTLLQSLCDLGLTAIGFETVEEDASLPLLAPMSNVAGRLSIQIGAHLLHQPQGGKGVLLGGLPGVERGRVVIFGAGSAGGNAALLAASLGAEVIVFDVRPRRLEAMRALGPNVTALYPYPEAVCQRVKAADLVVGAVLLTGRRAPHVVDADMVRSMTAGSVIVDISVDQGGCVETTRPTTYAQPTYLVDEVVHFAVTNMPGAVPRSASQALSAVLLPHVADLAQGDWRLKPALRSGVNVSDGRIVHPGLRA